MKSRQLVWSVFFSILMLIASSLYAETEPDFPCELRLIKTECWKNIQVTVQAIDTVTQKEVGPPVILTKNAYQIVQPIVCHPKQTLAFKATIDPPVWAESANAVYPSVHFWQAPSHLPLNASKWIVSLCFSKDFSSVPLPLATAATCSRCQFEKILNAEKSVSEALSH